MTPPSAADGGSRRWLAYAVVAVVVAALLTRFLTTGSPEPDAMSAVAGRGAGSPVAGALPQAGALGLLQDAVRATPDDPAALTRLGVAYLADARANADPSSYAKAEEVLERARGLAPDDATTLVALGLLATARHDFAEALDLGRRAFTAAPGSTPLGVVVDALIETGRYDEATTEADRMVSLKPDVASLARVSYLQQLQGDTGAAVVSMQQAVTAAGPLGPDAAYVRTLLGDLHLGEGRLGRARTAYSSAQEAAADWPAAEYGLARAEAAAGDLTAAADRLREVVLRLPLPDYVATYGDVLARLGRTVEATEQYALVRAQQRLEAAAGGVRVDVETARFEADHAAPADAARVVAGAVSAQEARPTVFADDAVGWALHAAGRDADALPWVQRSTRLGTRDAQMWFHRAVVEDAVGRPDEARASLTTALEITPAVTIKDEPAARALAGRLGVAVPALTTR